MSITRHVAFGIATTWFSRCFSLLIGLFLAPILFRQMGSEELGLWYLLGQSAAFLALMDLGVSPTLTRRIALARAKSGSDPGAALTDASRREIADLVTSGARLYIVLMVLVFVLAWTSGLYFISQITVRTLPVSTVWTAWTLLCLSHAIGVWAALWSCILNGMGHVGRDAVVQAIVGALTIGAQITAVINGGGLVALAALSLAGAVASRLVLAWVVRARRLSSLGNGGRWNPTMVRTTIAPFAIRVWLTAVGAFMILQTDRYFIALFRGADDIPVYHAAYQLVWNLSVLALTVGSASSVFVSYLWQAGEIAEVHKLVQRGLRLGLCIMVCGVSFLICSGPALFDLWLGAGRFVGYPVLIAFGVTLTLETHHVLLATASRATDEEPFALWALGAGVLNLLFTWILIQRLGLLGVALGTGLAQLLTNNWYASYRGLRRLGMGLRDHVRSVLVPVLAVLVVSLALGWLGMEPIAREWSGGARIILAVAIHAVTFAAACWLLVFNAGERKRLLLAMSAGIRPSSRIRGLNPRDPAIPRRKV